MPKSSQFQYFNSPHTTFNLLKDAPVRPDFDDDANTVTYHGYFEVENKTGQTADDVTVVLPYIWAVAPDDGVPGDGQGSLGPAGPVALDFENVDFEDGAWTVENFNGIEGLNLEVTAEIVPLDDHPYTTGSVAAGSIASNPSLTDDFGPSSADYPLNSKNPPETLDEDDRIPSVNLGDLEAHEDVPLDLVFTYQWTLNGLEADYNALRTAGAVYTLSSVDDWPV
jgi:hypothetical protein